MATFLLLPSLGKVEGRGCAKETGNDWYPGAEDSRYLFNGIRSVVSQANHRNEMSNKH
jgi:hypothetical protein